MEEKKYLLHVSGMHCRSCELYLEAEAEKLPGAAFAKASVKNGTIEIRGALEADPAAIAARLERIVSGRGYQVGLQKSQTAESRYGGMALAALIAACFIALFVLLQKLGVVNLVSAGSEVSYGTAFVVGIVASLSTCMAVVGGLLLSLSATFAKEKQTARPQLLFHAGRLVSFFVLGGLIGAAGAALRLTPVMSFALSLLIAAVMLVLGINLLDVFPWAKKLQPSMPRFLSKRAFSAAEAGHSLTPLVAGLATFFLPCGFTQSMQVYTLTTGSFLRGSLTMLFFAFGTLPVLGLISFSFLKIQDRPWSGVLFKAAGLIVIAFALFNLQSSLVAAGLLRPVFNF